MSTDGQATKCYRNIAENFNRLSRAHERYRRQTDRDGRAIAYSEREREFTFAKNRLDKFWSDQDILYDYKADLHGIGNRSVVY